MKFCIERVQSSIIRILLFNTCTCWSSSEWITAWAVCSTLKLSDIVKPETVLKVLSKCGNLIINTHIQSIFFFFLRETECIRNSHNCKTLHHSKTLCLQAVITDANISIFTTCAANQMARHKMQWLMFDHESDHDLRDPSKTDGACTWLLHPSNWRVQWFSVALAHDSRVSFHHRDNEFIVEAVGEG